MAKQLVIKFLYLFVFGLPLLFSLRDILSGSIPFWHDLARDFLLAQGNLAKLTLIGPPSGIPNVFYGPYWIWLLSLAMLISRDPRFITIVTLTLPYFVIIPLILLAIKRRIPRFPVIGVWLLFILSYPSFATQLWNPNFAPLLLFVFTYQITTLKFKVATRKNLALALAAGITGGLVANFHLSFGIGLLFASTIFVASQLVIEKKRSAVLVALLFFSGIGITFIPFIFFELRHGFNQTIALGNTFVEALINQNTVVAQVGMNRFQIISYLLSRIDKLLQLPPLLARGGFGLLIVSYFIKPRLNYGVRLIGFLCLTLFCVTLIYLSTKNPVWEYHFLAMETALVLLMGVCGARYKTVSLLISSYGVFLLTKTLFGFPDLLNQDVLTFPSLMAKENIVTSIYADAKDQPFAVAVYSPSLYTFDYDYLFDWKKQEYPKNHLVTSTQVTTYLIIPSTTKSIRDDFVNYKTPAIRFSTENEKLFPDGTQVIKRTATSDPKK